MSSIVTGVLTRGLHVSATDREIIRHVSGKFQPRYRFARSHRKARHKAYRACIDAMERERQLMADFRL